MRRNKRRRAPGAGLAYFAGLDDPAWIGLVDLRSKALWRAGRIAPAVLDWVVRAVG
jgi:hypothetical protein